MSARILSFPCPVASDAEFNAACALEVAGKFPEAISAYVHILERTEDPRALINLGTIMYGRRHYVESEALYRRATLADPGYVIAWFNLGNALDDLAWQGRRQDAIEAYRTAIRLDPTYADAHYNLAVAMEGIGRPRLALKHWRAYLRLDPTSVFATRAKMKVWRITKDSRFQVHGAPGNDSLSL